MESKQSLPLHTEETVKDVRRANPKTVVWFATYHYTNEGYQDYHIVEELCFGQNKLVISNESVLTSPLSGRPSVLDNVSLIVNCNMASPPPYTVRTEKVICHPVHAMPRTRGASDTKLAAINEDIWAGLQKGNVVIHCLAGVHRASCIVVSHALFRHYKLQHTHISSDIATIYTKLASIRKGVQPLGYLALVTSFREFLEREATLERAQQALRAQSIKEAPEVLSKVELAEPVKQAESDIVKDL
jgi:protein tyrosine phosphatase